MTITTELDEVIYPESDGKPMAENTTQFRWITTIKGGLDATFKDDPNVFVAGDLLWYPVRGHPEINYAPDTMVVIGRPKHKRKSYKQWLEGGIGPQVTFEILSDSNDDVEMRDKLAGYERYGVQEYYLHDPKKIVLEGWQRQNGHLVKIDNMQGWVSPLLGIRFELDYTKPDYELRIYSPDGELFVDYVEVVEQRRVATDRALRAEQQRDQERARAEQEYQRAEQERLRAERLAARLKAAGLDLDEEN